MRAGGGQIKRGRLIGVAEGLTVLSEYDYDDNGNRLSHTTPDGTVTGSYDDQDRLIEYGAADFTFGENGELETKTDTVSSDVTSYIYDARGSLLSVTLPDTTLIEYVIDGQARRVGKKVDGVLVQGFLYKDQLRIAAELDGAGDVVSHFSYIGGSHTIGGSHSPDWMTKGGELYRFVKDQVGSVRLVVKAVTGDVAQELEYDEFGVVTTDTNPGFQPFGFAGGLYDVDTGLTRFGARDYDARVGRWTSKDPIRFEAGYNLYAYTFCDPTNLADPSGLQAVPPPSSGETPSADKGSAACRACSACNLAAAFFTVRCLSTSRDPRSVPICSLARIGCAPICLICAGEKATDLADWSSEPNACGDDGPIYTGGGQDGPPTPPQPQPRDQQ